MEIHFEREKKMKSVVFFFISAVILTLQFFVGRRRVAH